MRALWLSERILAAVLLIRLFPTDRPADVPRASIGQLHPGAHRGFTGQFFLSGTAECHFYRKQDEQHGEASTKYDRR
jgi:hypothetical protein